MRRIARLVMGLALVAALMVQAAYAADSVSAVKLNQVQQRNADLTMYVSLSDAGGAPVAGDFTPDQFSIAVDGRALDVDSVQAYDPQTQGIHYVFSVDVSKSLDEEMMQNIRAAMYEFVDNLGPNDLVSIITFGEVITPRILTSNDSAAIRAAIDGIQRDEDKTALYKGVIDAVEIAASQGGRSSVIVITDGENDATEEMKSYTMESIYDSVNSAQVPLYCLGLNDKNGVDAQSLLELANVTGGKQYVLKAEAVDSALQNVRDIMYGALELHATLVNTENKAGFDEISTFKVGIQNREGGFVTSNELQQNINWRNVPAPQASPSPTPIPQISLELDEVELQYVFGETTTITGAIEVEQGSVAAEDLSISVNGEAWRATMLRNGDGYTFSATGSISDGTGTLEVQAEIKALGIASRIQRMTVAMPTPAPTATPAPVLSVELDDSDRGILFEPGAVVDLSGVINVQGEINPDDLTLYINGAACDIDVFQINRSQYEFKAQTTLADGGAAELSVQVQLGGTDIYSRVQKLFLVTPSPTPDPELYLSLSEAAVEYVEGETITIRGNIEVLSGEIAPEDLALYARGVRWEMTLEQLSDSTYGFTAENTLMDGSIDQLDVKVRLLSNSKIVSNSEKLAVTTPVPTASPTPTARPVVTPPPTQEPTAVPATVAPVQTEAPQKAGKLRQLADQLSASGKLGYAIGGLALLVVLIVALIVVLAARARRRRGFIEPVQSASFNRESREGDEGQSATHREDAGEATQRSGSERAGGAEFVNDEPGRSAGSGTVRVSAESSGTVRLDADRDAEVGGTQRIEEPESIEIVIEESRDGRACRERRIRLECDQELVFGRNGQADEVIADGTVSGRHMVMTYDGEEVYVVDIGSTNGTKLNGSAIVPREPHKLADGDELLVGKTLLKLRFDKAN